MSFEIGDRVIYIPRHAGGNRFHPDCEHGEITSMGSGEIIFVRFGNDTNSEGCLAHQLMKEAV